MLGVTPGLLNNPRVSGSCEGGMHVLLHVLVVLLCSVYRVFSSSLHYLGSSSSPPFSHSLIHYLPSRFSTVLPVQHDGCWGRVFWQAGLVAEWQVGKALRCSSYLGL